VIRGIARRHELEITVDGQRVHLAAVGGPEEPAKYPDDPMGLVKDKDLSPEDINNGIFERLQIRIPVKAGRHAIGVAFIYQSVGQEPQLLQPLESRVDAVDAAGIPQVDFVMISGPLRSGGAATHRAAAGSSRAGRRAAPRKTPARERSSPRWRAARIASRPWKAT